MMGNCQIYFVYILLFLSFNYFNANKIVADQKCSTVDEASQDCRTFCDIGFVLDTSGSIKKHEYVQQKQFVVSLAQYLGISKMGNHYGIVLFGQYANVEIAFNEYSSLEFFKTAVLGMKQSGSITRIDRGLLKAYKSLFSNSAGYRATAKKIIILLTDGSQSKGADVIDNKYLADAMRSNGILLYVIGIGNKVNSKELFKIADSDNFLYQVNSFGDLLSQRFLTQFNKICKAVEESTSSVQYYVSIKIINDQADHCNVRIKNNLNEEIEIFIIASGEETIFNSTILNINMPIAEVFVRCSEDNDVIKNSKGDDVTMLTYSKYRYHTYVLLLKDEEMKVLPNKQVVLSVQNLLEEDTLVFWELSGKLKKYKVRKSSSRNNIIIDIYSAVIPPKEVVFHAQLDSGKRVLVNGHYEVTIELIAQIKPLFLFINKENAMTGKNYSFSYTIHNVGDEEVYIQMSNREGYELKKQISRIHESTTQRPISMLLIQAEGNEFAFLKSFLPVIDGSNMILYTGTNFEMKVPFSFTLKFMNLFNENITIVMKVMSSVTELTLPKNGHLYNEIQFSFMPIIPAIEIESYSIKKQKKLFVNNKIFELVKPQIESETIHVYISAKKAQKRYIFGMFVNTLNEVVTLKWLHPSKVPHLFHPLPPNHINIPPASKKKLMLEFLTLTKITRIQFEVVNNNDDQNLVISNRDMLHYAPTLKRAQKPDTFLITKQGKLYFVRINAINNLTNDVELKWEVDETNGIIITESASKFIISGKNQQIISLKFRKNKPTKSENRVESIQFSALDIKSQKSLFVNSLHTYAMNATDFLLEPVDLIIKKPSFQYFFVFEAINQMSHSVYLQWTVNNSTGSIVKDELNHLNELILLPKYKHLYSVKFTSNEPLTKQQLQDVLYFQAFEGEQREMLLVNGSTKLRINLFERKEQPAIISIGTTESYKKVDDLTIVKIMDDAAEIRWKIGPQRFNYSIEWSDNNNTKIQNISRINVKQDDNYFYYTIKSLRKYQTYYINIRKIVTTPTKDTWLTVFLDKERSPSLIDVVIKNDLEKNAISQWYLNEDKRNTISVLAGQTVKMKLVFANRNLSDIVKFQFLEENSKFLLMYTNAKDVFQIIPQGYEKQVQFHLAKGPSVSVFQSYYAYLSFSNLAEYDLVIAVKDINDDTVATQLLKRDAIDTNMLLQQMVDDFPLPYYITATSKHQTSFAINGELVFKTTPFINKIKIPLYISSRDMAEDLPKTYFVDMYISNEWKQPLSYVLFINGNIEQYWIPPYDTHRQLLVKNADNVPSSILSKIVNNATKTALLVNGEPEVHLNYTVNHRPTTILINRKGVTFLSKTYFLLLMVYNNINTTISLQWQSQVTTISPLKAFLHKMAINHETFPEPIKFAATDKHGAAIFLDGENLVLLQPSLDMLLQTVNLSRIPVQQTDVLLTFINFGEEAADISLFIDEEEKHLVILPKSLFKQKFSVKKPTLLLQCKSSETGDIVMLNGSASILMNVSAHRDETFYVGASKYQMNASHVLNPYLYNMNIKNLNTKDITIQWYEIKKLKTLTIEAGQQKTYRQLVLATQKPPMLRLKFFGRSLQDGLLIGGKNYIFVDANRNGSQAEIILNMNSAIRIYFLTLYLVNTLPYEVEIVSKNVQVERELKVEAFRSKKIQHQINVVNEVTSVIVQARSNTGYEYINGDKAGTSLLPSRDPTKKYLFIGFKGSSNIDQITLKALVIHLTCYNARRNPVVMQLLTGSKIIKEITVTALSQAVIERTLTTKKSKPEIEIRFMDPVNQQYILFDNTVSLIISAKPATKFEYIIKHNINLSKTLKAVSSAFLVLLNIENGFRGDVILSINNKKKTLERKLVAGSNSFVVPFIRADITRIEAVAYKTGKQLYISGRKSLILQNKDISNNENISNIGIEYISFEVTTEVAESKFVEIRAENQYSDGIELTWMFDQSNKKITIKPDSLIQITLIYASSVKRQNVTFTATSHGHLLYLNNLEDFVVNFTNHSTSNYVAITGTAASTVINGRTLIVEFVNQEPVSISIQRMVTDGIGTPLSDIHLDADERKRVYISFPKYSYKSKVKAYETNSKELLTLGNKFTYTFYEYLSPNVITLNVHKYSTYETELYYQIDCNNMHNETLLLVWIEKGKQQTLEIPSGDRILIQRSYRTTEISQFLSFSAESNGEALLLNGLSKLTTKPAVNKEITFVLITNNKGNTILRDSSKSRIDVEFYNHVNESVNIFWDWPSVGGYVTSIPALSKKLFKNICGDSNSSIEVVFTGETVKKVLVEFNKKAMLTLYTSRHNKIENIHIDEVDSNIIIEHLNVEFYNTYPLPVNIDWHANGVKRFYTIQPNETTVIRDVIRRHDEQMLAFVAWDMKNKNNVLLNKRKLYNVILLQDHQNCNKTFIEISKDNGTAFFNLFIDNVLSQAITLKWVAHINTKSDGTNIIEGVEHIPKLSSMYNWLQYFTSEPTYVNFKAFNTENEAQLYINNYVSVNITTTMNGQKRNIIGANLSEDRYDFKTKLSITSKIVKRNYVMKIGVTNLLRETIAIRWTIDGKTKWRFITPYYFNYIIKENLHSFELVKPIKLQAFTSVKRVKLLVNDQLVYRVQANLEKYTKFQYIYVSQQVTTRRAYFHFQNPTKDNVMIHWRTLVLSGTFIVASHQSKHAVNLTLSGGFRVQNIRMMATTDRNETIMLNSNAKLFANVPYRKVIKLDYFRKQFKFKNTLNQGITLTSNFPELTRNVPANSSIDIRILGSRLQANIVQFSAHDRNTGLPIPINKQAYVNVTLKDASIIYSLGGKLDYEKYFVLKLWVNNNHTNPVKITWKDSNRNHSFIASKEFNEEVNLYFQYNGSVHFEAYDVINKQPVFMNKNDALAFTPLETMKYAKSIILDGEISMYDYFYQISVTNKYRDEIELIHEFKTGRLVTNVPALTNHYSINTPLANLKSGVRQQMKVYAYDKTTKEPFFVNGEEYITILPSLDQDFSTKILTGIKKQPLVLFQYSLLITALPGTPHIILRYNFKNIKTVSRVPKWAKDYKLILTIKSYKTPKNISFHAFSETRNQLLRINGNTNSIMTPFYNLNEKQTIVISNPSYKEVSGPSVKDHFTLYVNNYNDIAITLKWKNEHENKSISIPNNVKNYKIPDNVFKGPTNIPANFTAHLKNHLIRINKQTTVPVYYYENTWLNIFKVHVVKVTFENQLNLPVTINWNNEYRNGKINIIDSSVVMTYYIEDEEKLYFKATSFNGNMLSLNQNKFYVLHYSPQVSGFAVIIDVLKLFYAISVRNTELYDTVLTYSYNDSIQNQIIKGLQSKSIFLETVNEAAIFFTSTRVWMEKPMLINNNTAFTLTPTSNKTNITKVCISAKPKQLEEFKYIYLAITNILDIDIVLKWSTDQEKLVPKNTYHFKLMLSFVVSNANKAPIQFHATDNNKLGVSLKVNNQAVLAITPYTNKHLKSVIVSSSGTQHLVYNVHLLVRNNHDNNIVVQYKQAGTDENYHLNMKSKYRRWYNLAFVKDKSSPMSILITAYDTKNFRKLKVNNNAAILHQPRQHDEMLSLHVGGTVPMEGVAASNQGILNNYPYYFGIHIINRGDTGVNIHWRITSLNGDQNAITVPAKQFREHKQLVFGNTKAPWIAIRSSKSTINGRNVLFVQTSITENMHYLYVNAEEEHESDEELRFISMKIENMLSTSTVLIKWSEGDVGKSQRIEPLTTIRYDTFIKSSAVITLRGYIDESNQPILMNGRDEVFIQPSIKRSVTYIRISGAFTDTKRYFISFVVYNLMKEHVTLSWIHNNTSKTLQVGALGLNSFNDISYDRLLTTKRITAFNSLTKATLFINGRTSYTLEASANKGKHVLVIGGKAESKANRYEVTLQISNKLQKKVALVWFQEGVMKKYYLQPNNVTNKLIRIKSKGRPSAINFTAIEEKTNAGAFINGESYISVQPRMNGYYAHIVVTSKDLFHGGELKYAGNSLCKRKMDIMFLLDSSGSVKRFFPYAKKFITMLTEQFSLSKDYVQVGLIDFSEEAILQIPLNQYYDHGSFENDVESLPYIGYRTRLGLALQQANTVLFDSKYGARTNVKKLIFLITDGRSSQDYRLSQIYTSYLNNIIIVTVGISGTRTPDYAMISYVTNSNDIYLVQHGTDLLTQLFLDTLIFNYCKKKQT